MSAIESMFCDGGLVGRNPSSEGGTWAYALVDAAGIRRGGASGAFTPAMIGLPVVTNNVSELMAAIAGLEALPPGWAGFVYTDSGVTQCRITPKRFGDKPVSMRGVPLRLQARLKLVKERLGPYTVALLGGHPSRADLDRGFREDGYPVSVHNVWCDQQCGIAAVRFKQRATNGLILHCGDNGEEDANPAGPPVEARGKGV